MQMQRAFNVTPIHECSYSSKLSNIKKGLILAPNLTTKLGKIEFLFGSSAYQKNAENKRPISARINQNIKSPSPSAPKDKEIDLDLDNRRNSMVFDNIYFDKSMLFFLNYEFIFFGSLSVRFIEEKYSEKNFF